MKAILKSYICHTQIIPDFYCKCPLFHLGIVVAGVDDCDGGGDAVVAVAVVFCVVIAGEKSRSCKGKTFQKCPITNEKKNSVMLIVNLYK